MSELINKLNQYRSMGDKFYPEDIVVIEDIWALIDEIERLTISLQAQEELTMNWYNKVKKARDLFYEKCRISQNGAYIFNQVDYEELSNILGSDKE